MSQVDVVALFMQYLIILAPLVVVYCFVSILFSWIKKLFDAMSGRGW